MSYKQPYRNFRRGEKWEEWEEWFRGPEAFGLFIGPSFHLVREHIGSYRIHIKEALSS